MRKLLISHIIFRISGSTYVICIYYFLLATVKKPTLVQEDWHYFWDTILVAWTLQWCAWISALLCTFVGSWRCRPVHRKGTILEFQTHKISKVQGGPHLMGFLELHLFFAQAEAAGAHKCAQEHWDSSTALQWAGNQNCSGVPESQCSCVNLCVNILTH